ncbi:MAG: S9 family peptidase [Armatimonadetes bacterium]|nr:S9 family peptidase [Armatimonadota bacterium]
MTRLTRLWLIALLGWLAAAAWSEPARFPESKTVEVVDDYHGVKVRDPYRWLEDADAADTQEWVERQNQFTRQYLDLPVRQELIARLTRLWDYERYTSPFREANRYFFFKNDGLQNQAVFYGQDGLAGQPFVVIDPNGLSQDGTTALSELEVSRDGKLVAYAVSVHGSDWQEIRVRDIDTGKDFPETLKWAKFTSLAWTSDHRGFFYSRFPDPSTVPEAEQTYYDKVYYHRVGTPQQDDVLVFEHDNKLLGFSPFVTEDGRYVGLSVWNGTDPRTGLYVREVDSSEPFTRLLEVGEAYYEPIDNQGSVFYVVTDFDAPRRRLVAIDLDRPGREHWKEILPQSDEVIDFAGRVNEHFVVAGLKDAHHKLRLHDMQGRLVSELELPTIGAVSGLSGKNSDREFFFQFASYLHAGTVYRYDFETGKLATFREPTIDFPSDRYTTEIAFARSRDGTRVPIFLTYRKGLEKDGSHPTLLYGYGGFNINMTPRFAVTRLAWLERGGVLAVAVLRGGSEYGEEWHQAGMLGNKQNVFDDFIAAAEYLIAQGYTRSDKLAINGGSNGGLLVAACETQRPELFGAVLCQVPVADMLRFHKFTVGRYWVPEYGSSDDPEQFRFLYAYSPLHNLKPGQPYPATLITTADTDDRVVPAHAKKFAAALQASQGGMEPILIRVETRAGHGAGKPTSKQIEEAADLYTFLLRYLGEQ